MTPADRWSHSTYDALDGALMLTASPPEEAEAWAVEYARQHGEPVEPIWPPTALLTVRGKDHDLTAEQLRDLGRACMEAADRIEGKS